MKVKCIAKLPNEEQARHLGIGKYYFPGKQGFHLVIGQEYHVYGLTVMGGAPWVELESDTGYIFSAPLCLFEITDNSASRYWKIQIKEGDLILWPSLFYRDYFFEHLADGAPEVEKEYKKLKLLIESEAFGRAAESG